MTFDIVEQVVIAEQIAAAAAAAAGTIGRRSRRAPRVGRAIRSGVDVIRAADVRAMHHRIMSLSSTEEGSEEGEDETTG